MTTISELTSLQNTLNAAIDAFKAELAAQKLAEPSLNTSKPHPIDEITYLPTPAMYEARRAALASLGLIKNLIASPYDTLAATTWMTMEAACVRVVADIDLAGILSNASDPEVGMTAKEIEEKTGVDALKIERVLRLIMTQGWFRESKPGYFANNRQSNLIKKGAPGYHLATYMNELFNKVSVSFPQMINHADKDFRKNDDPYHTAFNLYFNTEVSFFGADGWLTKDPEEMMKFGLALGAVGPTSDPGVAADFPWDQLAAGKDAIVDVGGGQGTLCCSLAKRYPNIKHFIVQDLPESREAAESYIAAQGLVGRVEFEAQDFFTPQKRNGKYLFVMQRVLHDWSTEKGAQMLGHIRDVLNKDSGLLVIDTIIQAGYTSPNGPSLKDSLTQLGEVYKPVTPPAFVPVDFGEASRIQHQINVSLTALCNSFERTQPQLKEMVELAQLKIKQIHATRGWASITEIVKP